MSNNSNNTSKSSKRQAFTTIYVNFLYSAEFKRLSPSAKVLYLYLKPYTDLRLNYCFPSNKQLSERSGLDQRTVYRCLQELSQKNIVKIVKTDKNREIYFTFEEKLSISDKFVISTIEPESKIDIFAQKTSDNSNIQENKIDNFAVSSNIISRFKSRSNFLNTRSRFKSRSSDKFVNRTIAKYEIKEKDVQKDRNNDKNSCDETKKTENEDKSKEKDKKEDNSVDRGKYLLDLFCEETGTNRKEFDDKS